MCVVSLLYVVLGFDCVFVRITCTLSSLLFLKFNNNEKYEDMKNYSDQLVEWLVNLVC